MLIITILYHPQPMRLKDLNVACWSKGVFTQWQRELCTVESLLQ